MTTNKPEVVAFLPGWTNDPLIRLSDYEALQAECEELRRDVGPGVDVLTGALERVKIADDEPMHHARHGSAYWNSAVIACIDAIIAAHRKQGGGA